MLVFYLRSFSSHMICTSAPRSRTRKQSLRGVRGEKELHSVWDVMVWDSFSQALVLVMVLGLHKSCTSRGREICMALYLCGCKLEEAAVVRAEGAALLRSTRSSIMLPGRRCLALLGWGSGNGLNRLVKLPNKCLTCGQCAEISLQPQTSLGVSKWKGALGCIKHNVYKLPGIYL